MMTASVDATMQRAYLHGLFVVLMFGLTFIPAYSALAQGAGRFIVYGVPIAAWVVWPLFSPARFAFNVRVVMGIAVYALLIVVSAWTTPEPVDQLTWVNALRPVFYLLIFVPFLWFDMRAVKMLLIIFAITTAALASLGLGTTTGGFDFAASQGPVESGLAMPLGAILLFCLIHRQPGWAFLAFILFMLAFKRMSMLTVMAVLFVMVFNAWLAGRTGWRDKTLAWLALWFAVAVGVGINLFYYEFFEGVAVAIGAENSVDTLTMGRLQEFDILAGQFADQPLLNRLFGNGPGAATRNLLEVTITYPSQVHNSFLLYYYDFGVIGFTLFFLSFLVVYSRNSFGLYLLMYNVLLMVTDNSFTQHYHQITCLILLAAAEHYRPERKG